MKAYIAKHELLPFIEIKSIFTVYHNVDMHKRTPREESHDFPELAYVSDCLGEHKFTLDGKEYSMKKGDLFIIPANARHQAAPFNKSTVDMISFAIEGDISKISGKVISLNGKQKQIFLTLISDGSRLFVGNPPSGYEKGVSLHERTNKLLLQKFKNQFELLILELYLSETEPELSTGERSAEEEFDRIAGFMKSNVNKKLLLSDISKRFSLSETKIQRLFKKFAGCAPMQYYIDLKLNAAKELMLTTPMNSSEISRILDFSSVNYFSRLFKQKTGASPAQYKKTIKFQNKEVEK